MKHNKFRILGGVSALALFLAIPVNQVDAATVNNGGNIPIQITANVTSQFDVTTTNLLYDEILVRGDTVDTATASISQHDSSFTPDPGTGPGSAYITNNAGTQARAVVTATLLPNNTPVTVSYNTVVDLGNGTSSFAVALVDNLNSLVADSDIGVDGTAGSYPVGGPAVPGTATTDATGQLTFGIGGSITTKTTNTGYSPGAYTGSFNVTISY